MPIRINQISINKNDVYKTDKYLLQKPKNGKASIGKERSINSVSSPTEENIGSSKNIKSFNQTDIVTDFSKNNSLKKSSFLSSLLKGLGLGVVLGFGFFATKNYEEVAFLCRNFGKKGIQNFIDKTKDNSIKTVFDKLSKTSKVREGIDKMGICNIEKIAKLMKEQGVRDVVEQRASVSFVSKQYSNFLKTKPIIDFQRNNRGYALYKEINKTKDYCDFMDSVKEKIDIIRQKKPGVLPIKEIKNSSEIAMSPMTKAFDVSRQDDGFWTVNYAMLGENTAAIKLFTFSTNTDTLLNTNRKRQKGFEDFLKKFANSNIGNITLSFQKFSI